MTRQEAQRRILSALQEKELTMADLKDCCFECAEGTIQKAVRTLRNHGRVAMKKNGNNFTYIAR